MCQIKKKHLLKNELLSRIPVDTLDNNMKYLIMYNVLICNNNNSCW